MQLHESTYWPCSKHHVMRSSYRGSGARRGSVTRAPLSAPRRHEIFLPCPLTYSTTAHTPMSWWTTCLLQNASLMHVGAHPWNRLDHDHIMWGQVKTHLGAIYGWHGPLSSIVTPTLPQREGCNESRPQDAVPSAPGPSGPARDSKYYTGQTSRQAVDIKLVPPEKANTGGCTLLAIN